MSFITCHTPRSRRSLLFLDSLNNVDPTARTTLGHLSISKPISHFTTAMADLWTHEFCLGCDKQTDGTAYCSESCRLADYEKTSMPGSMASSPGLRAPSGPWTANQRQQRTGIYLAPAIDFTNPQPFGSAPSRSYLTAQTTPSAPLRTLTTSNSNSSLCSMSTVASTAEAAQLSQKTRLELQGYAASFDHARLARRRSY